MNVRKFMMGFFSEAKTNNIEPENVEAVVRIIGKEHPLEIDSVAFEPATMDAPARIAIRAK